MSKLPVTDVAAIVFRTQFWEPLQALSERYGRVIKNVLIVIDEYNQSIKEAKTRWSALKLAFDTNVENSSSSQIKIKKAWERYQKLINDKILYEERAANYINREHGRFIQLLKEARHFKTLEGYRLPDRLYGFERFAFHMSRVFKKSPTNTSSVHAIFFK